MQDQALQDIVMRCSSGLDESQQEALYGILCYLHRSSLPVLRIEHGGDEPVLICGESDRYALSVSLLLSLWQQLRRGEAIDWRLLPRAARLQDT